MTETLNNDSTKKQLGFEYQKLIALEYCLNAKDGEYVYIECFGDVQFNNLSIEVKHRGNNSNLTSNSVDVWKTLKNIVEEYDILKSNDVFILHTTSNVSKTSIFYKWNELSKKEKYEKLKNHEISETSKPFKDKIFDEQLISTQNLLEMLDKFKIDCGQPKIKEKLYDLKKHSVFKIINDNLREAAIGVLIQHINSKAIDNSNKWEICISDFNNDIRFILGKFTKDYIPFPDIESKNIKEDDIKGFKFIDKLNAIRLRKKVLHRAFGDYIRSEEAYEEILKINPTVIKELIEYEVEIKDNIETEKSKISYELTDKSFNDDTHVNKSREVYFNCIQSLHTDIVGIKNTRKYYRNGRIHSITESTDFEWLFNLNDLS